MSQTVTLRCPVCDRELTASLTYEPGDWVPYGSTTVRTPGSWLVDWLDLPCPGHPPLPDDVIRDLEEQAFNLSNNPYDDSDRDDPFGGDRPDD